MRRLIQKGLNIVCRNKIERLLPGIREELRAYSNDSETTGTQWVTLYLAMKGIMRHKPTYILESGTGSSTLVLAALIQKMRATDPNYLGEITSMESVEKWYKIAIEKLPEKYSNVVEIVLGPRKKFEMGFFRGYVHSNIPTKDYSFVLLDGPNFIDDNGMAFCADVFRAMDLSNAKVIHGVVDGRTSSVFVIQTMFGFKVARYYHSVFVASFSIPSINFRDPSKKPTRNFKCSLGGRLSFMKFRKWVAHHHPSSRRDVRIILL